MTERAELQQPHQGCAANDLAPFLVDEFISVTVDSFVNTVNSSLADNGQASEVRKPPWLIGGDVNGGCGDGLRRTVPECGQTVSCISDA